MVTSESLRGQYRAETAEAHAFAKKGWFQAAHPASPDEAGRSVH